MADESAEPTRPARTISFDEVAVVRRCQDGDTAAYGELVIRYQDRIYNVMRRMAGPDDAEELAQEAFLKAFEKIDQFRGGSRFYTWLFRIAMNLAISRRRRGAKVKFLSMNATGDDEQGQSFTDTVTADLSRQRTPAPEANVMARETSQQIEAALDALDEEFRAAIVLRDIEELDYADIAEILDVPVGTVKSRIHRGRNILKDKLAALISK
ncbi:MAG: sigma-70 family RNA polymerase sigma factor [Planctomycetes bacterium]|jgi:RNA polymerase sigma-70 factor (ECF subfamily)|nr:sigma-70 family RNA polymerase sigma factor [Phycisphaerae bacterium]NBB96145.1 sigma-70 family RNA polymerase sigma factor [Planctomycetota bacterium]